MCLRAVAEVRGLHFVGLALMAGSNGNSLLIQWRAYGSSLWTELEAKNRYAQEELSSLGNAKQLNGLTTRESRISGSRLICLKFFNFLSYTLDYNRQRSTKIDSSHSICTLTRRRPFVYKKRNSSFAIAANHFFAFCRLLNQTESDWVPLPVGWSRLAAEWTVHGLAASKLENWISAIRR